MRRNSAAAIGGGAKGQTQKAPVARARPKERRAGQRGERGDEPDPVAKLTQEHGRRLAIAGVSLGVVMRAQVRRPIDEDRAQEREQREGAERGRRDGVASSESARLSSARSAPTSSASMTTIPAAANAYQRRKANIAYRVSASARGDAADHRLDVRVEASSQREQAGEALGQLERADDQHETADIGHAARRDRECRRVGDEHGGGAEREDQRRRRVARKPRAPRAIAGQDRKREGGRRGVEGEQREGVDARDVGSVAASRRPGTSAGAQE